MLPSPTPPTAPALPFGVRLSSTRRGARLARLLVERQLEEWGLTHDSAVAQAVVAITAELAANAATHGRTPGRDFVVRLSLATDRVRVEVADTRPDVLPPMPRATPPAVQPPSDTAANGRGLLLVDAFATHWGCERADRFVKTVWAEVAR